MGEHSVVDRGQPGSLLVWRPSMWTEMQPSASFYNYSTRAHWAMKADRQSASHRILLAVPS